MTLRTPIAFALGASGAIGIVLLRSFDVAVQTMGTVSYTAVAKQSLLIVPMFVLMGGLAFQAGLARDVFGLMARLAGRLRSAMPIATVLACAGFATVTGSSVATVAAFAKSTIGEMQRRGFSTKFASGLLATSGTLGVLIPPSIVLVMYAIVSGESVGQMLIAGVVPGLITVVVYSASVVVLVHLFPRFTQSNVQVAEESAERGHRQMDSVAESSTAALQRTQLEVEQPPSPRGNDLAASRLRTELRGVAFTVLIFSIVVAGVFFGVFTATESAAIAALVATGVLFARGGRHPRRAGAAFLEASRDTASTIGMIFAILVGASIFGTFLVSAGVPRAIAEGVLSWGLPSFAVLLVFLLVLLLLGTLLDGISIILLTVPIMYPIITELGFSGIWFGVIVVKFIELGLITPPLGLNAFVISGVMPHIKVETVFKGLVPFYVVDMIATAILIAFPVLTLFLPTRMFS